MVRFQGLNAFKPVRATCRLNMLFVATQAPEHGGRQVINVLSSNSSKSLRNYVFPPQLFLFCDSTLPKGWLTASFAS